jgi:hypothetical protein
MRTEFYERLKNSDLANAPPWQFVSSPELAKALGVHLQTLSNWRMRGVGPAAAPGDWFKGRPIRYQIGQVMSWAYEEAGKAVEPWEFFGRWLRDQMGFLDFGNRSAVMPRVQMLMKLGREFRPQDLTATGRRELGLR